MTRRRPYIGPSDSQANAEALARRGAPYTHASEQSFRIAWDWHRREPTDLREAVRMVRKAHADEVPTRLHEGYDSIGPDGTPKMTTRAEGYIFGSERADDAGRDPETGQRDLVGYYRSPFRARLAEMTTGDTASQKRAAIVSHVTIGAMGPQDAAVLEGVPPWCAKVVAEDAIRAFLRSMSDIRVHRPIAEGATAA